MYSIIACLTLHCLSSANSNMAGKRAFDKYSTPITSFTNCNLEMMFNLTSGNSSFNNCKKIGNKFSIVSSLPSNGANPDNSVATAALTCCD